MSAAEKKERIDYLWGRLRAASKIKGGLNYVVNRDNKKDRENFGLDSDMDYELSESQELEEQLHEENEDEYTNLAWFLINPESNFSMFQNIQVQLVTWATLILTPILLVFGNEEHEHIKNGLIYVEWIVDISWTMEICLNFITASHHHRTFKSISFNYLRFWFWVDSVATFPAIIFL